MSSRLDDRDGDDSDLLIGKPHPTGDDEDDADAEDREQGVARRVNPLPIREEEEEELSEADIMEELDPSDLDKLERAGT